jgi:hypothetical protein
MTNDKELRVSSRSSGHALEECPQCGAMQVPDLYRFEGQPGEVTACANCGVGYDDSPPDRAPVWLRFLSWLLMPRHHRAH